MTKRFAGNPGWPKSFTTPTLFPDRIPKAARWPDLTGTKRPKKPWLDGYPRMIFLNDMGDPFAPFKRKAWQPATHWLQPFLSIIERSPHIWMLLTKWPDRFAEFAKAAGPWPCNLWGGTSVTGPDTIWRIQSLVEIGGQAARFVSLEPLLKAIAPDSIKALLPYLDWVIVGGETGPGARPMHPDWVRSVRDQCVAAGVPFFFKSWGAWREPQHGENYDTSLGLAARPPAYIVSEDGTVHCFRNDSIVNGKVMLKRKAAGRVLDGRTWDQLPEATQ